MAQASHLFAALLQVLASLIASVFYLLIVIIEFIKLPFCGGRSLKPKVSGEGGPQPPACWGAGRTRPPAILFYRPF